MNRGDLLVTRWGAQIAGRRLPCAIGRGGISATKREGDGATPLADMQIVGGFYRPDRMARPARWLRPIGPRDLWSDASGDAAYNSHVRAPYTPSHERLRRADRLYDVVLVLDWNLTPALPGKGSAIFIHIWRKPRHPTEGCVAFSPADMDWLLRHIGPGTRVSVRA